MKLIWSERARRRLEAIETHIAMDDPAAATRHIILLVTKAGELAEFPRRGRRLPEYPRDDLREIIVKGYRILYEVTDEAIEVLTVFEGHRLLRDEELED